MGGAALLAFAQQVATTPVIRDVRPVKLPAYSLYRGIPRYAPTPAEYARALGDGDFVMSL